MIQQVEGQILVLLLIAAVVGMVARRLRVPYTLALVVAGLFLGFVHLEALTGIELSADVLLLLLLPALLFEAAFHINFEDFRRDLAPILILAVGGVLVAVAATAGLLWLGLGATGLVPGFQVKHALIFASVIAATDPISVLALFRQLGVPKRLYLLVEGESLLNDGVAVVVFLIVTAAVGVGGAHGEAAVHLDGAADIISYGVVTFARMAFGGVLVGAVVGGAVSVWTSRIDDHLIETTLTTLVAYGSFLVAEQLHCSGVLSSVAAGVVMGSFGSRYGMSATTRNAVEDFWEYAAFLANSFIFLLVGLELDIVNLVSSAVAIAVAFAAVVLARMVAIYGGIPLANRFVEPISMAWRHVLSWGGLRGSLSMVLVLTLPADFALRAQLVTLVFGVVAVSLFLQGLTVKKLLERLGLAGRSQTSEAYERFRGRALIARRALESLRDLHERGVMADGPYQALAQWYERRLGAAETQAMAHAGEGMMEEHLLEGLRRLADVERATLRAAVHAEVLGEKTASGLEVEIDHRLAELTRAEHTGDEALAQCLRDVLEADPARDEERG